MNKKIPFDIRYRDLIESGKWSVQTNDGRDVRIICWDKREPDSNINLVALVPDEHTGETERVLLYFPDGSLVANPGNDKLKLVIVTDQPELDKVEDIIYTIIKQSEVSDEELAIGLAKEVAKKLRNLISNEVAKEAFEKGKAQGEAEDYAKGFKDAQKCRTFHYEPTCGFGGVCTNPFRDCINCPRYSLTPITVTTSDSSNSIVANGNIHDTGDKGEVR